MPQTELVPKPSSHSTVGRVIVVSAAILVLLPELVGRLVFGAGTVQVVRLTLGALLCAELLWGVKWARWVAGANLLVLAYRNFPLFGVGYFSLATATTLRLICVVYATVGLGLLFHRGVSCSVPIFAGRTSGTIWILKHAVRVLVILVAAVIVVRDVWEVTGH